MIELEKEGHYSRGPFRGYKFSAFEGGFRVPFVARWPGVVPAGARCDSLIGLNDLPATFADITGTRLKSSQAPDSVSLLPLLKNPRAEAVRKNLVFRSTHAFAFRSGQWKLLLCPGSGCAGRYGNTPPTGKAWKDAVRKFGRAPKTPREFEAAPFVQFYNLENDVGESKNRAGTFPKRVQTLVRELRRQVSAGRSTPGATLSNDVSQINIVRKRVPN